MTNLNFKDEAFRILLTRKLCLQAFVSEYAVTGKDAGTGSLLASLAEAAFLIGLEKNRFPSNFFFPGFDSQLKTLNE